MHHPPITPSTPSPARRPLLRRIPWKKLGWRSVWVFSLLVLFYTVENWRGARAWSAALKEMEAKGEVLDWEKLIPKPIPASENFFEHPIAKEWFYWREGDPRTNEFLLPNAEASLASRIPSVELLSDWKPFREAFGPSDLPGSGAETHHTPAHALLAAYGPRASKLQELREASQRPLAQLVYDYSQQNWKRIGMQGFVNCRVVAQQLATHAKCSLAVGATADALDDIRILVRVSQGYLNEPSVVGVMIGVALSGLTAEVLLDGAAHRLWSQRELVELKQLSKPLQLNRFLDQGLRVERAGFVKLITGPRKQMAQAMNPLYFSGGEMHSQALARWMPRGWMLQNGTFLVRAYQAALDQRREDQVFKESRSPYNFLGRGFVPNVFRARMTAQKVEDKFKEVLSDP